MQTTRFHFTLSQSVLAEARTRWRMGQFSWTTEASGGTNRVDFENLLSIPLLVKAILVKKKKVILWLFMQSLKHFIIIITGFTITFPVNYKVLLYLKLKY